MPAQAPADLGVHGLGWAGNTVGQLPFGENHGKKPQGCVCRKNESGRGLVSGGGQKVVVVCIQRWCAGLAVDHGGDEGKRSDTALKQASGYASAIYGVSFLEETW